MSAESLRVTCDGPGRRDCTCPRSRHEHGTSIAYTHDGCRGAACRAAAIRAQQQYRKRAALARSAGTALIIPNIGTQRRLRALAALGWTGPELAARFDITPEALYQLQRNSTANVHLSTAQRVAALYDELGMRRPDPWRWNHARAARAARDKGWVPPLAWDDDDLDNPDAQPWTTSDARAFDPIAVERIMAGTLRLNRFDRAPERIEAIRQLAALGLTDQQISDRVGMALTAVNRLRRRHGIPSASKGAA